MRSCETAGERSPAAAGADVLRDGVPGSLLGVLTGKSDF